MSYVKNTWYVAGWAQDFEPNKPAGAVTEIPGQDLIPPHARVRAYPICEKHSWIWVWMGDTAACDEALIPPAVAQGSPTAAAG
jgi:phenylpropionate dioxygenase-like ring-hydroxylating dioxygenase large terminal subunit